VRALAEATVIVVAGYFMLFAALVVAYDRIRKE
jgi:hypothetical protein